MNPSLCRIVQKCSLFSAILKIYVSCYCVGTYERQIISAYNFSRTTWQSISMCFVRSWNTGFAAICNVVWLSQKSRADKLHGTFKSCNRYATKTISKHVLVIAWFSAFADDLDTFVCFFYFHEIIENKKKQYPDTNLRVVWQPPQFES